MQVIQQKNNLFKKLFRVVQGFEFMAGDIPWVGKIYHYLFYKKLVEKEIKMAGVRPGMRVAQVGCGPFPYSAIMLAGKGCEVQAIDNDPRALRQARIVVSRLGLEDKIELQHQDGAEFDYTGLERVFVSLHVQGRERILDKAVGDMGQEGRIIFRNPRGWLRLFYPSYGINQLSCQIFCRCREKLGKESLCVSRCKQKSLAEARSGEVLIIKKVPVHPLLPALGLRPGKKVCLQGRQCFNGPLLALVDDRKVALGVELANLIEVQGGE